MEETFQMDFNRYHTAELFRWIWRWEKSVSEAIALQPGAPGVIHSAVIRCELFRGCQSRCSVGGVPIYVAPVFHCHPCSCQDRKKIWQTQFVESQRELWEKNPDGRGFGLTTSWWLWAVSPLPPTTCRWVTGLSWVPSVIRLSLVLDARWRLIQLFRESAKERRNFSRYSQLPQELSLIEQKFRVKKFSNSVVFLLLFI